MTYHLASLRLRSIGERSARFSDYTITTTGHTGTPHDHIVWLRNGGGKSSLLSLFYALLLPRRADFMGKAMDRALTDYVDGPDTSHTIAVWHPATNTTLDASPDRILVTGAVYEWSDLRRPANASRNHDLLGQTYYAFFAVPGVFDADHLPLTDGQGHPTRRTDYLAALRAQAANHPKCEWVTTETYGDWERALAERGLDPDLFRSQKKMNHVEGGVENLFTFTSPKDFINFLLGLTVSPATTAEIAASVGKIADKVAQKPAMLADRDFCLEAADALEHLAAAHTDQQAIHDDLTAATDHARDLAAQFAAAISTAETQRTTLTTVRDSHTHTLTGYSTDRATANENAFLYRVRAAQLRLDEARTSQTHAEQALADAAHQMEIWQAVGPVAEHRDLTAQLAAAQQAAEAEARELAPLAHTHDTHAARLRALLNLLAEDADTQAGAAATAAAEARSTAHDAGVLADRARADADEAGQHAAGYRDRLTRLTAALRRAADQGLLPSADTDPAAHAETLTRDQAALTADLATVRDRRAARPAEHTRLADTLLTLGTDRSTADHERTLLRREHDQHTHTAETLATHPRVTTLVQATEDNPVDLWADADTLLRALDHEIRRLDAAIVEQKVAQAEADRVLTAHTDTGYLPSTLDADRLVGILTAAGIPAEPGWAHLRTLLPTDRLPDALTDPHLARIGAGVVVPTDQATAARDTLIAAGESTVALVAVFTAAAADHAATQPPTPAADTDPAWSGLARGLLDKAAAESDAAILTGTSRDHDTRTTALRDARAADQALRDQVTGFLAACPDGHLAALATQIADLDTQIADLDTQIAAAEQARRDLTAADTADAATETDLTAAIHRLGSDLARLEPLAADTAHRPEWETDLAAAEARLATARADADRHRAAVDEAKEAAHRHDQDNLAHIRAAKQYRTERSQITYLATPDTDPDDRDVDVAGADLDTLRRLVADARHAYDVPAAQHESTVRVRFLTGRLHDLTLPADPTVRAAAEAALATPAGASRENRAAALAAATEHRTTTAAALGRAQSQVTKAQEDLDSTLTQRARPPRRALPVEPADAAHATDLAEKQATEAARLGDEIHRVEEEIRRVDDQAKDLTNRIETFTILAGDLPAPTRDSDSEDATGDATGAPAADPFPGDATAAQATKTAALTRLTTTQNQAAEIEKTIERQVGKLRVIASRYDQVPVKAKDRLTNDPEQVLAANAEHLATQLRLRADQRDGDLASINADQAIVTETLANAVADNFDMLNRTQRFSDLPDRLGVLSGKRLLKIRFTKPTDADLRTHVAQVIEESINRGNKPDGLDLLKAATHAAVGARGFVVKVLKPVHDLTPVEEDIDALGKWSGGERLTAGVALYCTIAKVRAVNTGNKDRYGGMLILDNPIGRASHGPLIELQRKVAAAQGVQLIYATGVKDFDAVSHFPGITRLENRIGRAGNRRYIVDMDTAAADAIFGTRIVHSERPDRVSHP